MSVRLLIDQIAASIKDGDGRILVGKGIDNKPLLFKILVIQITIRQLHTANIEFATCALWNLIQVLVQDITTNSL